MYRIEVKPGEEAVFRTIEELATGIRNGFITPRARIYHAASQKWLPIEFHPHYKKALDGNFTPTSQAPQPSLSALPAPTFSFPGATPAGAAPVTAPEPAAAPAAESAVAPAPQPRAPALPTPAPEAEPWEPPAAVANAAESPVLAMQASATRPRRSEPDSDSGPVERYSPVSVLEARRAAPAPAPAPEIVLPNITYPELPPSGQTEHRATARRSRRAAGRPFLLVGSAAVLVFAGQRWLASRGSASMEPAAVTEATPLEAAHTASPPAASTPKPGTGRPAAAPTRAAAQRERPQPLVKPPSRPMTPGPAFAASVPARVVAGSPSATPAPPPAASSPSASAAAAPRSDSTAIAPAPTAIELDLPAALPGDSIAPLTNERDSLAIKRILKAVTGRKANPTAP